MAYSGLETLFQNLGPTTASMVAGQREAEASQTQQLADQMQRENIAKAQQAYGQAEQTNPLEVQQKQLANQTTQAELPGKVATSSKLGTEANLAEKTVQSQINLNNSINELGVLGNKVKTLDSFAQHASRLVGQIGTGPDAEAKKLELLNSGQIPAGPITDLIKKTPAQELPAMLEKYNTYVAQQKDSYIQKVKELEVTRESAKEVAKIHAGATIQAAQIAADSRITVAASKQKATDIISQVQSGKLTPDKAAVAFDTMATMETDPNQKMIWREQASKMEKLAMQLKSAGAGGKLDIGAATGLPTQQVTPALGGNPTQTVNTPPQAAIQHLRSNPALAAAFDAKYGQGASQSILNQR